MGHRYWPPSSGSYAPLTYVRGIPVDVTMIIIVTQIITMLITTFVIAFGAQAALDNWVNFSLANLSLGKIWTAATYAFCNNIAERNIFFALELVVFFFTGREVERFIGRNNFAWFYAMLILMPPALMTPLFLFSGSNMILAGSFYLHFAVLIGFATIYPNVEFFFRIKAKWLAVIFLSVSTLVNIASHQWLSLALMWISVSTAWLYLKYNGVGGGLTLFESWQGWSAQRQSARIEKRRQAHQTQLRNEESSVDQILEKISRDGMDSLSPEERSFLERASQKLSDQNSTE
ncbi:MAG: DUF6576 domain-containing protein [Verrucomicrobiota bacterium]